MSSLRSRLHDAALTFFMAIFVYVTALVVATRIALGLATALQTLGSAPLRLAISVIAVELPKAPMLWVAAWLLGRLMHQQRPLPTAVALVLLVLALEATVAAMLGQAEVLFGQLPLILLRAVTAFALVWVSYRAACRGARRI